MFGSHFAIGVMREKIPHIIDIFDELPIDRQASHSVKVAHSAYAISTPSHLSSREELKFLKVSKMWQQVLFGENKHKNTKPASQPIYSISTQNIPTIQPPYPSLQESRSLKSHLNSLQMKFKSKEQLHATHLALQRSNDVIVVMGTGEGKSLVYQLPAFIESHYNKPLVTIVISPLIAIREEQCLRAKALGINSSIWNGDSSHTTILFVPISLIDEKFFSLVADLKANKQLGRVVFDEVHEFLLSSAFRPSLQRALDIRNRGIDFPILFLSATLDSILEAQLKALTCNPSTITIRKPTGRKNIIYQVIETATAVESENILIDKLKLNQPTIIFCLSPTMAEIMASKVGSHAQFYHGELNFEKRSNVIESWNDQKPWLFATTALGAGIDRPDISVFFLGGFYLYNRFDSGGFR